MIKAERMAQFVAGGPHLVEMDSVLRRRLCSLEQGHAVLASSGPIGLGKRANRRELTPARPPANSGS